MTTNLSGTNGRPLFLASVTSAEEAAIVLGAGAGIIDAKDPTQGALGALPLETIRAIVAKTAGRKPVSATVGDLPANAEAWVPAIEAVAAAGVDFVKVGVFATDQVKQAILASANARRGRAGLIAVLLADQDPDFSLIADFASAGYAGVMLDTAEKAGSSLLDAMSAARCAEFVKEVRRHGMLAGLAGSLSIRHIAQLQSSRPDVLGFRGALCRSGMRGERLDGFAAAAVAHAIAKVFSQTIPQRDIHRVAAGARR